jgi:hypothetical protein
MSGDLTKPEVGGCAAVFLLHAAITRLVFVFLSLCVGWGVGGEAKCLVHVHGS